MRPPAFAAVHHNRAVPPAAIGPRRGEDMATRRFLLFLIQSTVVGLAAAALLFVLRPEL